MLRMKAVPSILTQACLLIGAGLLAFGNTVASAHAQAGAEFYKDKTITIIVGFGPGGGYDLYPRVLARHIARHIPGNPTVIVQNMPGVGSVRAANHVYLNAPKDGTVIAAVNQSLPMLQILGGKTPRFDPAKQQWLGSMESSNGTLYTWHTSPTKTIEDARKRETILGGTGTNSDSHIFPTLLNNLLGTKFKMVHGYTGGGKEVSLAIERGEVEGRGGNAWASLKSASPDWLRDKKLNILVQIGLKKEPELQDVPLLLDLVNTEEEKQIVRLASTPTEIGFAHWVAPEVPAERVELLRKAYAATLADPAFLAEAEKAHMTLSPKTGEELQALVAQAVATPKALREKTAQMLEWQE